MKGISISLQLPHSLRLKKTFEFFIFISFFLCHKYDMGIILELGREALPLLLLLLLILVLLLEHLQGWGNHSFCGLPTLRVIFFSLYPV